jgi:arylsulfatase A-like enzyme
MSSSTRRGFLASLSAAPFVQTPRRRQPRPVNVVKFMTDDHGAWALGAYGCRQMHTPHVDALAKGGMRFDRAFACTPVCSPSRMTYMTGRLPSTHGVQDWLRPEDSFGLTARRWLDGHPTYSEILAEAGYTLGMCGKWHMGGDERAQKGFTYWCTVPGGGGPYRNVEFLKNGVPSKMSEFKTDSVGDAAVEFLDRQKNRKNPFYLLVPFYAPHTPYDFQPEAYRKPYEGSSFDCYPNKDQIHPNQNRGLRAHHGNRESMLSYSALITGLDANVGRVVEQLEKLGMREDTLIVFTADQGWNAGHHGVWGKGNGTWPFNMYDESIRVPMIWNHPRLIRAGQVAREMVSSYDYFPTILDYLDVQAPADERRVGRSYANIVRGRASGTWDNRLYFEYSYVRGIRTENLKLIERTSQWPSELYDLEADPGEARNLIGDAAYSRQRESLSSDLRAFFAKAGAPPLEQWRGTTRQNLTTYESIGSGADVRRNR